MFKHDYHRQLTVGERMAVALFHFEKRFTAMQFADFVGISNHEARKRLHALEYFGVVTVIKENGLQYQRADLAPDSTEENMCEWCGSTNSRLGTARAETKLGDYMGLSGNETVTLCEKCLEEVSTIVNEDMIQTESGHHVLPIHPICQAEDCDQLAARSIPSKRGHPNNEWKLCPNHYDEVEGIDPWYELGQDWILKKLKYRCPEGIEISYSELLPKEDSSGISCPCGNKHISAEIDR